jgi:maleylacetoacetate isomerase
MAMTSTSELLRLHGAARSSASFRVRIALYLKGLPFEAVPLNLLKGDQFAAGFASMNPAELVPVLEHGATRLTQSVAIIEYLEERYPQPPLLPHAPELRAYVRAAALSVACEIHPLNNLRVLLYLVRDLSLSEDQKNGWYRHWVERGLAQLEAFVLAEGRSGRFMLADEVTLADVLLVPQIFNARRFDCRLDHVPTLMRIFDHCMEVPAFEAARPERQSDFS